MVTKIKKIYKISIDNESRNVLIYTLSIENADVAELVDALVLGTSVNDVGVRVPSSAPLKVFEPDEKLNR